MVLLGFLIRSICVLFTCMQFFVASYTAVLAYYPGRRGRCHSQVGERKNAVCDHFMMPVVTLSLDVLLPLGLCACLFQKCMRFRRWVSKNFLKHWVLMLYGAVVKFCRRRALVDAQAGPGWVDVGLLAAFCETYFETVGRRES